MGFGFGILREGNIFIQIPKNTSTSNKIRKFSVNNSVRSYAKIVLKKTN